MLVHQRFGFGHGLVGSLVMRQGLMGCAVLAQKVPSAQRVDMPAGWSFAGASRRLSSHAVPKNSARRALRLWLWIFKARPGTRVTFEAKVVVPDTSVVAICARAARVGTWLWAARVVPHPACPDALIAGGA